MSVDFMGVDGGRLAMAFATGCVATFTFVSGVGAFLWKVVGRTRLDRISELEKALEHESARCAAMEARLVDRIQSLETVLMFEVAGNVRQNAQIAISELRQMMQTRLREQGDEHGEGGAD